MIGLAVPSPGAAPAQVRGADPASLRLLLNAPGVISHSGPYPYISTTVLAHGHLVDVVAEGRDLASAPVERPKLAQGTWVHHGEIVVERGFADALNAHVGDPLTVGSLLFRVAGIAVTAGIPAYPSSLCHLACVLPTSTGDTAAAPQDMGLVWATNADAERLASPATPAAYLVNLTLAVPTQAAAFVAAHSGLSASSPVLLYSWQSIRDADDGVVHVEQIALQFGTWLLGLLAVAGLVILVAVEDASPVRSGRVIGTLRRASTRWCPLDEKLSAVRNLHVAVPDAYVPFEHNLTALCAHSSSHAGLSQSSGVRLPRSRGATADQAPVEDRVSTVPHSPEGAATPD